jgi:hypothetical protein
LITRSENICTDYTVELEVSFYKEERESETVNVKTDSTTKIARCIFY